MVDILGWGVGYVQGHDFNHTRLGTIRYMQEIERGNVSSQVILMPVLHEHVRGSVCGVFNNRSQDISRLDDVVNLVSVLLSDYNLLGS